MPKRVNNIFHQKLKFKYMLEAYERAADGKHNNKEVILYKMDLANNITTTLKELLKNNYKVQKYNTFKIYEPKERIIQALPFKDRVVQQWYVEEFIKPIYVPKFINDTYACIEERGVHSAVKKFQKYMHNKSKITNEFYILKCDISKFFYSIDKDKLFEIIQKSIKDKEVLNLTKIMIYSDIEKVGIPIGNYTSQYFANIYLNELDHFIKEKLKIKHYVRYMDDFVLILDTKEECKIIKKSIEEFLEQNLYLKLNKKTNYFKAKQGVNFCGYKLFNDYILLKKQNKNKTYKKVKIWNKLYKNNKLDIMEAATRLKSWIGHAKNADTYKLIKDIEQKCNWIYKGDNTYEN